jgi:hypothetical protein
LAEELDKTYREVARRLPDNPEVRFEKVKGKEELILTQLDGLDEPPSLIQLRKVVAERLPRVELAELVLEVALRTGFTEAFTHLIDRSARTADFALSLCAALLAEAYNTGPEPFIRHDTPALRRDRIAWVKQNYLPRRNDYRRQRHSSGSTKSHRPCARLGRRRNRLCSRWCSNSRPNLSPCRS